MGQMKRIYYEAQEIKQRIKSIPIVCNNTIRCDCCFHAFPPEYMEPIKQSPEWAASRSIMETAGLRFTGFMCKDQKECLSRNQQEFM